MGAFLIMVWTLNPRPPGLLSVFFGQSQASYPQNPSFPKSQINCISSGFGHLIRESAPIKYNINKGPLLLLANVIFIYIVLVLHIFPNRVVFNLILYNEHLKHNNKVHSHVWINMQAYGIQEQQHLKTMDDKNHK